MKERYAVAALLAAALGLRLWRLGDGLWIDEIVTWNRFMHLPLWTIPTVYGSENQHYLFSILARLSLIIFGESNWAFRLPAALFGVAGIWSVWWFGRKVTDAREAFLAAALIAFSYHHVWFSQNARGYSGLLFWTMLSGGLLLNALESNCRRAWLWWAISAALGVYTQATMAFVLMGQALVAGGTVLRTGHWKRAVEGFIGGALLTILLHAPALGEIRTGLKGTVSVVQEWKSPLWAAAELFRGLSINFMGAAVASLGIAVFGLGLWSYARVRLAVVGLLLLPPAIGVSVVLTLGHHIWPRFFFFAFGFATLVAVRGVVVSTAHLHRHAPVAALLTLTVLSAISVPAAYGPKQDFAGALNYVKSTAAPNDAIVAADLAAYVYRDYYHAGFATVRSAAEVEQVLKRGGRVWLLYTLAPVFRAQLPELYEFTQAQARIARRFPGTLGNGAVTVAVFEPSPSAAGR